MNYLSRRLLCNVPIQSHSGNGCTLWYPLVSKTLKTKLHIVQKKCINLCLELSPRGLMSPSHFWRANWFPVVRRVELRTFTTVSKYSKGVAPFYLSDMFVPSLYNYNAKLQIKYKKVSFLGPKIWVKICSNVKQLHLQLLSGKF